MRHRGGAFLSLLEGFERFEHFGALEVAYLKREAFERAAGYRHVGYDARVAVALDDLRRDGVYREAEELAYARLDFRRAVGVCADGAGELADHHFSLRLLEALDVAAYLGVVVEQLEAEGRRLGVYAVGAARAGRHFVFDGLFADELVQLLKLRDDDVEAFAEHERRGRVYNVAAGQSEVDEAARLAYRLGDARDEGYHIVLRDFFYLVDALDGEAGFLDDVLVVLVGDDALLVPRARGGELDVEPAAEAVLVGPNFLYFGCLVARYHVVTS